MHKGSDMKNLFIRIICLLVTAMFAVQAFAYDATFNFSQQYPELVAGWKIKAGPTKSGPYPYVIDCKKPAAKTDGTFDCIGTGLTANPIYAVAVNYDSTGKESAQSNEATTSITVQPPTNLKVVITVTTAVKLSRYGNVIAVNPVVTEKEVPADQYVKEGTKIVKKDRYNYTATTVTVM